MADTMLEALFDPVGSWGLGDSTGNVEQDRARQEAGEDIGLTVGQEYDQLGESPASWHYTSGFPDAHGNTWYERAYLARDDPAAYKRLYIDPQMTRTAEMLRGRSRMRKELLGRAGQARGQQLAAASGGGGPLQTALRYSFRGSTPEDRKRSAEEGAMTTQYIDYLTNQKTSRALETAQQLDVAGEQADEDVLKVLEAWARTASSGGDPSAMLGSMADLVAGPRYGDVGVGGYPQPQSYEGFSGGYEQSLSEEQLGGSV